MKEFLLISNKRDTISAIFIALLVAPAPCRAQVAPSAKNVGEPVAADPNMVNAPVLAAAVQPASSDAGTTAASAPADTSASAGDWHFAVSPYLWFPGVHGGIGVNGAQIVAIHASAGDLLSHFRFGLMGVVEPSYKRIVMPLDIVWGKAGRRPSVRPAVVVRAAEGNHPIQVLEALNSRRL
jgi:hypothetical protein